MFNMHSLTPSKLLCSPDSGDDCCGSGTDDIDELIDVELSIPIDIPNSKQGLDFLVGEP